MREVHHELVSPLSCGLYVSILHGHFTSFPHGVLYGHLPLVPHPPQSLHPHGLCAHPHDAGPTSTAPLSPAVSECLTSVVSAIPVPMLSAVSVLHRLRVPVPQGLVSSAPHAPWFLHLRLTLWDSLYMSVRCSCD